jgi:hypothetical protein
MCLLKVIYKTDLDGVDWAEMKATLRKDAFDNGRSPEQLKASSDNSYATCIAYIDERIVGTARVLSDGVPAKFLAINTGVVGCITIKLAKFYKTKSVINDAWSELAFAPVRIAATLNCLLTKQWSIGIFINGSIHSGWWT